MNDIGNSNDNGEYDGVSNSDVDNFNSIDKSNDAGNNYENSGYAGISVRFAAWLFDRLLFSVLFLLILFFATRSIFSISGVVEVLIIVISLSGLLWYLIHIAYQSLFTTYLGGSIGKLIAGIYVTDENNNNLSIQSSLFRYIVGYPISMILGGLGFVWIIRDEKNQGWHDQLTGSYVRKTEHSNLGIVLIVVSILLFLIIDFVFSRAIFEEVSNNEALLQSFYEFLGIITKAMQTFLGDQGGVASPNDFNY